MLKNFNGWEIVIVLVIILLLFGARKLPDLARSIGASAKEFRKGLDVGVEDDEETQEYMRSLLSKEYNLKFASSGKEAWELLSTTAIDIVLMDLSLQGEEDGLTLTRRIREQEAFAALPVIAVTAHAFPKDRIQSLEAGCNAYFSKPFQIEELKRSMEALLSGQSPPA